MRCGRPKGRHERGGFTLLEVLISLALIGALLGALFTFYFNLLQSRERIALRAERIRGAELLIEHVERALLFCVAGDAKYGSGIAGSNDRLSVLTRGVLPQLAAASANTSLMDLQRVEISTSPGGPATLRRQPMQSSNNTTSASPAGALATSLGMVRIRYYDGSQWRDTFDSMQAGALPRAIEIAVWYDDPHPADDGSETDDDASVDMNAEEAGFLDPLAEDRVPVEDDADDWPLPDRHRVIVIPDAEQALSDRNEGGGAP